MSRPIRQRANQDKHGGRWPCLGSVGVSEEHELSLNLTAESHRTRTTPFDGLLMQPTQQQLVDTESRTDRGPGAMTKQIPVGGLHFIQSAPCWDEERTTHEQESLVQLQQTHIDFTSTVNPTLFDEPTSTSQTSLVDTLCESLSEEDMVQLQAQETLREIDGLLATLEFQTMTSSTNVPSNPKSLAPVTESEESTDISSSIESSKPKFLTNTGFLRIETNLLSQTSRQSSDNSAGSSGSSLTSSPDVLNSSSLDLLTCTPQLCVVVQPPNIYRPRYEKEATRNPKGFLKNTDGESVVIRLENVRDDIENIIVDIGTVTRGGVAHPTVYPTCFGRMMPADWQENKRDRTVMTVLKAAENYTKRLKYLGLKRKRLDGVDREKFQQRELTYFRLRFTVQVGPTAVTTETQDIHAVCPTTMTKLRRQQLQGMGDGFHSQQRPFSATHTLPYVT